MQEVSEEHLSQATQGILQALTPVPTVSPEPEHSVSYVHPKLDHKAPVYTLSWSTGCLPMCVLQARTRGTSVCVLSQNTRHQCVRPEPEHEAPV